jgi:hypothetical protein
MESGKDRASVWRSKIDFFAVLDLGSSIVFNPDRLKAQNPGPSDPGF